MPAFEPRLLFAVLGAVFLLLGAVRSLRAGAVSPQGRTWLLLGLIFGVMASWLHWHAR
ncbi:hypothetical protein [Roseateles violae]|uniref:Uncharacterized protein n=1 Tax=Roseateles violae TaxID=3058042 RepID=A0ABT8DPS9_9BURK|nr:hypothetical protein [Pelomonas sp. PFR6]MDN3920016.1 hypothetical protein [Pelomonas sp. PFR6]